jgi:predicted HTH domain antitoxin
VSRIIGKPGYDGISSMRIVIELADDIARHSDPAREAIEAVATEGYRSGAMSAYQARTLLQMTRFEFDGFLKDRGIWEHAYSAEDLEQDRETLAQLDRETAPDTPTPSSR